MNEKQSGVEHLLDSRTSGLILPDWVAHGVEFMVIFFVFFAGLAILIIIALFVSDIYRLVMQYDATTRYWGAFVTCLVGLGNFFDSISLLWTVKKCLLIGPNENGLSVPLPERRVPSPSVPPKI